ncbi:zinc ribbon domain-containing protein [Helicobacter pylori]|uniref:zinc ribbon domain-containing protein n=1 Tax=Helicobacter pylori TaxID=210 RepID=UPI003C74BFEC
MKAFLYLEKNYLSTSLLNYKQQHNGKLLESSPTIHQQNLLHCGSINHKLKLNHRQYLCPDCGYKEHRDINVANNIFIKGLSFFGVGNIHADFKEQSFSLVSVGIF